MSWTTKEILDGNGDPITMRMWDESGAGTGPFSFGQVPSDGTGVADPPAFAPTPTTAQTMSATFQLVDVPTDGTGAQREVAVAHGANPTAVAAAAKVVPKANRAGVPFMIGGHPNVITRSATIDDADGAQTNASLLTVAGGSVIVITAISVIFFSTTAAQACAVRIGFAAATLAAASEAGAAGILLEGKFLSGGGNQKGNGAGIIGVGADGEDLRITCDDPVGGSLFVTFSYYTVES
jgi:hypothetical protein